MARKSERDDRKSQRDEKKPQTGDEKNPQTGDEKKPQTGFDLGLGGIFKGLGDWIETLADLAEKGGELRREGTQEGLGGKRGLKAVYGWSVRVGGPGGEKARVEPFGNIRKAEKGKPEVSEEREPIVDVFDERDHMLVVAEMPGVDESQMKVELKQDLLILSGEAKDRKYRKEILLPRKFSASDLSWSIRSGILEARLQKG